MSKEHRHVQERWDAIIIGAGLAGLTTGAYAATNGKRVLLLEQYDVLGGQTHVFRRRGKWEFDVGVHYMENCGPGGHAPRIFGGLGIADRIPFRELNPEGWDIIVGPDFELKLPHGFEQFQANLIAAFPQEERALRRVVRFIMSTKGFFDRFHPDFTGGARDMAHGFRQGGFSSSLYYLPWGVVLQALGLSAKATLALSVSVGLYSNNPLRVAAGWHARVMYEFVTHGTWYPKGGGQAMSANLYEVFRVNGGVLRSGVAVERILVEGGKAVGVRLEGGEVVRSDIVVSAADTKRTYLDLVGPEQLPRPVALRARHWKMASPIFNTYFGLERDLRGTTNSNYYVIPSWDGLDSLVDIAAFFPRLVSGAHHRDRQKWVEEFTRRSVAMVQSSTVRDPHNAFSAPPGCAAVESMTLVPASPKLWGVGGYDLDGRDYRQNPVYKDLKLRITDAMLDRIDQVYPGARGRVLWSEAATPATQTRYARTSDGAAFGLAMTPSQILPFRPRTASAIPGLFLAGTSTAYGLGTTTAMLSGLHAASEIVGRDLYREVLAGRVFGNPALLDPVDENWDSLARVKRPDRVRGRGAAPSDDATEDPTPLAVGSPQDSSRAAE